MNLDIKRLSEYLVNHIADFGPIDSFHKFQGGQSNPTLKLMSGDKAYVLRKKPQGKLLKSAHAVDREYRVLSALAETNVPVASVYHMCTNPDVIGSEFYIMDFVDGNVYWDPVLPSMSSAARAVIYDQLNKTLADIHKVDIVKAGLSDYGKTGNYFERQIRRWKSQYENSAVDKAVNMDQVSKWLEENCVEDDGRVSLVHGDYRLDNLMFDDNLRVVAVMDWELSTLGHPFADLAYQCMQWRLPTGKLTKGFGGLERNALGVPEEAEYVASYCKRANIDCVDNWEFYLAFSFYKLAAILYGVLHRSSIGNSSNDAASSVGGLAPLVAEYAIGIIDSA